MTKVLLNTYIFLLSLSTVADKSYNVLKSALCWKLLSATVPLKAKLLRDIRQDVHITHSVGDVNDAR